MTKEEQIRAKLISRLGAAGIEAHLTELLPHLKNLRKWEALINTYTDVYNSYYSGELNEITREKEEGWRTLARLEAFGDSLADTPDSDNLEDWFPRENEKTEIQSEKGNLKVTVETPPKEEKKDIQMVNVTVQFNRAARVKDEDGNVSFQDIMITLQGVTPATKISDVMTTWMNATSPSHWEMRRTTLESLDIGWKNRQQGSLPSANVNDASGDEPAKPKGTSNGNFPKDEFHAKIISIEVGEREQRNGELKPTYILYRDVNGEKKKLTTDMGFPVTDGDWESANRRLKKLRELVPGLETLSKGDAKGIADLNLYAHYRKQQKTDGDGFFYVVSDYTQEQS